MKKVKFLNMVLENSELDESIREDVLSSYHKVKDAFQKTGIVMDDDSEFVFSNHIIALLKRIKAHSFVDDLDEEMLSQVSQKAFDIANKLVGVLFVKEGLPINRSEVFLVATHIDLALQKQSEK